MSQGVKQPSRLELRAGSFHVAASGSHHQPLPRSPRAGRLCRQQPHRRTSCRISRWLWRFDRFLQARPELAGEPVPVMLRHWASARPTANHAAECANLARVLDKALHRLDPAIMPKRPDPRPGQQIAKQWRRPYIYSAEEIRQLLDIAKS